MSRRHRLFTKTALRKGFPQYFRSVLPRATSGSPEYLRGEPTSMMMLAKEDEAAAIRLLEAVGGVIDVAADITQLCLMMDVPWDRIGPTLDAIDSSRYAEDIRRSPSPFTIGYLAANQEAMPGFERLLDRYRGMVDRTPFDVAIRWPTLAGSSPDVLREFDRRHPKAMGYLPPHEATHPFHEAFLVSVFGDQWPRWVRARGFGFGDIDDFHTVNMAASFLAKGCDDRLRPRSSYSELGKFVLSNMDLGFGNLAFVAQRWGEMREIVSESDFRERLQLKIEEEWRADFGWELTGDPGIDAKRTALSAARVKQEGFDAVMGLLSDVGQEPLPAWAYRDPIHVGRYVGRFLPRDDDRVPFIGVYTGNCQWIGGIASSCALHSCISPHGALFVVEDPRDPTAILSASWVWSDGDGEIVFDSVEGPAVRGTKDARSTRVRDAVYLVSQRMFDDGHARSVLMGTVGYGFRREHVGELPRWRYSAPAEPPDYDAVVESLSAVRKNATKYPPDSSRRKVVLAGRRHPRSRKEEVA